MKRSEMVKILSDLIRYNIDQEYELEDVDAVLEGIEEAGMLPPPRELIPTTCNILYYCTKHEYGKGEEYIQLWEEEYEKK